jgi:serine/threonine protein kinase
MNYAFQTETLAIMVLDLVTCGDLQEAINQAPNKRLSEVRVQFYVAEIVLALSHLHELGLMFRDLKPCNVLLGQVSVPCMWRLLLKVHLQQCVNSSGRTVLSVHLQLQQQLCMCASEPQRQNGTHAPTPLQDGHIKLTDMGGVAEFAKGTCLDQQEVFACSSPYSMEIGNERKGDAVHRKLSQSHRRRSIMGTHG